MIDGSQILRPVLIDPESGGKYIEAYGKRWNPMAERDLELQCFREKRSREQGGLGAYGHLLRAHNLIWPERARTFNEWMHIRFKTFSEDWKVIVQAGGSSTAKSNDAAYYALMWWWCNPAHRTVLVCSTTLKALTKRIWSYVVQGKYGAPTMPGRLTAGQDPKMTFTVADQKHGIFCTPLMSGTVEKTLANLIGIHPDEGLLVIVDEATDVTPAVIDAMTNWDSEGKPFQLIAIGNSASRLDTHGLLSEPLDGWDTVHPDTHTQWDTKYGTCLYFDCYKSPAVIHPEEAGKGGRLSFLMNQKKIDKEIALKGKDSPLFWRFVRGFWPQEDIARTVLTPVMCAKHKVKQMTEFDGTYGIQLAGLDSSFTEGGDVCLLRFATLGMSREGKITLDFGGDRNVIPLEIKNDPLNPVSYQIVEQAKNHCIARGIPPEHVAIDAWGFSSGVSDILDKTWSNKVHKVIPMGLPTEMYIDHGQTQKAVDVYDRRATELCFVFREFVIAGQIRGIDDATIQQFCQRRWSYKGRKISIEAKDEYKLRYQHSGQKSPDHADTACLILDLARTMGFLPNVNGSLVDLRVDDREEWERRWEESLRVAAAQREIKENEGRAVREDNPENWNDNWMDGDVDLSDVFGGE